PGRRPRRLACGPHPRHRAGCRGISRVARPAGRGDAAPLRGARGRRLVGHPPRGGAAERPDHDHHAGGQRAMSAHSHPDAPIWRQPLPVWAIAFASVIAFMGIGLVDPILPAIAEQLEATPVETELLFTSYLAITGIMMLFTSWVSSRIG